MSVEWCCEKLNELKISQNRIDTLTEIRFRLQEIPCIEAAIIRKLLSSSELFDCLEEEKTVPNNIANEQFDIARDIISICMSNVSITQDGLSQLLQHSLKHSRPRVKALALHTILNELKNPINVAASCDVLSDDIVNHVLDALEHEDTELGVLAINILTIILENRIDRPDIRDRFTQMLKKSEIIRCRVYELAVSLAKHSIASLGRVEFILDRALSELDNDDILMQMNILEILSSLASQEHGFIYMKRRQVLEVVSRRVEEIEQEPLDRLMVPAIMKFVGKIACIQPEKIITSYPHMIQCLFECLHSGDPSILPIAFDTLANLTQSQQGKLLLDKQYSKDLKAVFEDYSLYLQNLSSDLKIRLFNTLEIIYINEETVSPDVSEILHKWFGYLTSGEENMQFLMGFCQNPFPDIKVACLSLVKALCGYSWGIVALKRTAGFVEYLLDRQIEFDKNSKYAKFEIIKLLSNSSIFDVQTHLQLCSYVNEGAYFIDSTMDVATEGD